MNPVIELASVDKTYRRTTDRSLIGALRRAPAEPVAAVRGLDLRIDRGESVGILGHNGAGKTTLLRLLAGVTAPSAGRVRVAGRITPLISVGVGFHGELSGRENVRVNGAVLGLGRTALRSLEDAIIEFSELEGVLDTPVKFYSSGMLLRLAFSVAIHTDPDVLLVDELLAVGDLAFQQKCLARMAAFRDAGVTVVLVSHSVFTIREFCDRAIVMSGGTKVFDGSAVEAIEAHQRLLAAGDGDGTGPRPARVRIVDRHLVDDRGDRPSVLRTGEHYELRARLAFHATVADPHIRLTVYGEDGAIVYQSMSAIRRSYRTYHVGDTAELAIRFRAAMDTGTYQFTVQVVTDQGRDVVAHDVEGTVANVVGGPDPTGIVPLEVRATVRRVGPEASATPPPGAGR